MEQIEEKNGPRRRHFWIFDMTRVPEVGEKIDGKEVHDDGSKWKVRLVIKDPKLMDMLTAFDAIDRVPDHGSGFTHHFINLLEALVSNKRVI
ncbi:MAG: hypothetical protein M1400_03135 [Patescibacteria group bacterium]|nr:hypothetical protein [Patescibacteria group bacterium]